MKKRTKFILIVAAVLIGILVAGYFLYKARVSKEREMTSVHEQVISELWDKAEECRIAGDYDAAYRYLDSVDVLRTQLKNDLFFMELTPESEELFVSSQKILRLGVQADEAYASGDELRAAACLDAIDSLRANLVTLGYSL